jgi:hypothetical protein
MWHPLAAAVAVVVRFGRARIAAWRSAWRVIRRSLVQAVNLPLALIFLFEEWGWRPLAEFVARLCRFRFWARLEAWVQDLPPYGALCVFALPSALLVPLKLAALWLIAKGHAVLAGALFVGAKLGGTALVARIFMLTQPALMRLGWFARLYNVFVPWHEAMLAWIRASWPWRYGRILKERARRAIKQAWARWKPSITAARPEFGRRLREVWTVARQRGQRAAVRLRALYSTNSSRR